ncbi:MULTISPECIES: zinc ribbon domain-containing protein [Saccharothrix]|uniref:zinc ribbon domain-containing protein n=1 Tax=Saccharothrix TaxID=2071 RepID=UPI0009F9A443|nr:zinc ribbon domain-containing protein [Saccharothrix sp. CB00851]
MSNRHRSRPRRQRALARGEHVSAGGHETRLLHGTDHLCLIGRGERVYLLAGRLQCGLCGRKMNSHCSHGRAAYRCRHGHTSARTRPEGAPGNLYLREDHLLTRIAAHLTAAGIADNPGQEQTARLVDELGLVLRCDAAGVALLDRSCPRTGRHPTSSDHPSRLKARSGNTKPHETSRYLEISRGGKLCIREPP